MPPLETAINILDDATHARLDKQVISEIQEIGLPPGALGAASIILLLFLAANSEGCIDPKYRSGPVARVLLKERPDLQMVL